MASPAQHTEWFDNEFTKERPFRRYFLDYARRWPKAVYWAPPIGTSIVIAAAVATSRWGLIGKLPFFLLLLAPILQVTKAEEVEPTPDLPKANLGRVEVLLFQREVLTGMDTGHVWDQEGLLHFRGKRCSFDLPANQIVKGESADRDRTGCLFTVVTQDSDPLAIGFRPKDRDEAFEKHFNDWVSSGRLVKEQGSFPPRRPLDVGAHRIRATFWALAFLGVCALTWTTSEIVQLRFDQLRKPVTESEAKNVLIILGVFNALLVVAAILFVLKLRRNWQALKALEREMGD